MLLCALAGAVAGGALGYLCFTEEGRRLREDLEPKVRDLMAEFDKARALVDEMDAPRQPRADVRPFAR
jgi:hypothetical protein